MQDKPTDAELTEDSLRHWLAGHGCYPGDESIAELIASLTDPRPVAE